MSILNETYMSEEPEEYKKGSASFLGCHIDLSFRPLIPRVETEFWVERIVSDIQKKKERPLKILDIFSGSGCIGIAVLKHIPNAHVDFGEKNEDFIKQITKNLELNDITKDRATVIQSDVFEDIPGSYDYIFANPPYISRENKNLVQKSVLEWEDESTYFAAENGLFYIKKLLDEASKHLNIRGKMYVEFDSWQKPHIEQYAEKVGHRQGGARWEDIKFLRDQYRRWRVFIVKNM